MKLNEFIFESKSKLLETRSSDQILLELNVINTNDIQTFLADVSSTLHTDELKKWFIDRGKKYLINSEDVNTVITQFSSTAEPWMKKAVKRGDTLYRFMPSPDLRVKMDHAVDYLNALSDTATGTKEADQQAKSRAEKALKGLRNASMAQAIEASEKWTQEVNLRAKKRQERGQVSAQDEEGLEVVMNYGDLTWVRLTQRDCLDREGQVMGHCVASYWDKVKDGRTTIFSLRDPQNNPHATVEVSGGALIQVKGKQNTPPVAKYQPATIKLLNTLDVPPSSAGKSDIERMGFMFNRHNNKYGSIKDIGYKIYNKNDIVVYIIDGEISITSVPYIFLNDKQITTKNQRSYASVMDVMDGWKAFADTNIPGTDPDAEAMDTESKAKYKLVKFLSNLKFHSYVLDTYRGVTLNGLTINTNTDGVVTLPEDVMPLLAKIKDGNKLYELFKKTDDNASNTRFIIFTNKELSTDGMELDSDTNLLTSYHMRETRVNDIDAKLLNKYFEKLPANKKPGVFDVSNLTQNPKTKELITTTTLQDHIKPTFKSGAWAFTEAQRSTRDQDADEYKPYKNIILTHNNTAVLNFVTSGYDGKMGQGEWEVIASPTTTILLNSYSSSEYEDLFGRNPDDDKGFCNVVNKMDLMQFFTSNEVLDKLDDHGIFYNSETQKFTTDADDLGSQYNDGDENGFSAKKTQKTLKMYFNDNLILDIKLYQGNTIGFYDVQDQVSVFENSKKIADVLNFYKLQRGETGDTAYMSMGGNANKAISASGITYSRDGVWKGTNQVPKQPTDLTKDKAVIDKYNDKDYTLHKFKNNWLIKDKESNGMVATLITKGRRTEKTDDTGETHLATVKDIVQIDFNDSMPTEKQITQVLDAMDSLGWDDTNFRVQDNLRFGSAFRLAGETPNYKYGSDSKDDFLLDVDDVLFKQNKYIGGSDEIIDMDESAKEKKVVGKGSGGTWVQETYSPADYSIRYVLNDISSKATSYHSMDELNDNDKYITQRLTRDPSLNPITTGFTLYRQKQPVLRVKDDGLGRGRYLFFKVYDYDEGSKQSYKVEALTDETIKEWMPQISRLFATMHDTSKEIAPMSLSKQLKDMGYFFSGGKLKNLQNDPKLKGFMDGQITYEDGSQWVKDADGYYGHKFSSFRRDERDPNWVLKRPDSEGNLVDVIAVSIADGGINTIQFASGMRERTKVYRAFLNDIMDISDSIYHG